MNSTSRSGPAGTRIDVIIVGGGIIGTALARELAGRGRRVLLCERGRIAGEASGVAAGMLTPQAEADGPSAFLDFGLANRAIYADWVQAVSAEAALPIEYRTLPVLFLAIDEAAAAELRGKAAWQSAMGLRADWLTAAEVRAREPVLAPDLAGALLLPSEAVVDAHGLTIALAAAARRLGAEIREDLPVTALAIEGDRVVGVVAGGAAYRAPIVAIATGAWGSALGAGAGGTIGAGAGGGAIGAGAGLPIPADWIEPVRGQLLVVRPTSSTLRHVLYTHGAYAVPRLSGELVLGTTVEEAGFERVVTAAGIASIVGRVTRFAPALGEAAWVGAQAGLRPASRDGLPVVGLAGRMPGLALAIGHFRNGILLAPLTARLLADAIISGKNPAELAPFAPDRLPAPHRQLSPSSS